MQERASDLCLLFRCPGTCRLRLDIQERADWHNEHTMSQNQGCGNLSLYIVLDLSLSFCLHFPGFMHGFCHLRPYIFRKGRDRDETFKDGQKKKKETREERKLAIRIHDYTIELQYLFAQRHFKSYLHVVPV